jgi:hemoglobin-like flavoprotein
MFNQSALLRENLQAIETCGEDFIASMYVRLFQLSPEAPTLFANTCMEEQRQKLLMMFVFVLDTLDNPAYLAATIRRLGQIHSHYTIRRADFDHIGTALLDTFAAYLGAAWTPQHRAAWVETYHELTSLMLEGYASPAGG